jgi:hydroxypyruvate isomerase
MFTSLSSQNTISLHRIYYIRIYYVLFILLAHIQIAQVPDRHEPNTPGEIDYKYVLSLLELHGYAGYIGLEYRPKSLTMKGLNWIKEYGYAL